MKRSITGTLARTAVFTIGLSIIPALCGQTPATPPPQNPPSTTAPPATPPASSPAAAPAPRVAAEDKSMKPWNRFCFGFRVRGFPLELLDGKTVERSATTPPVSYTFTPTSKTARTSIGLSFEYILTQKLILNAEILHTHVEYSKTTDIYTGTDNTSTAVDERLHTALTERTKATYWDIPMMMRYQGLRRRGVLSKMYAAGGVVMRKTANIRTSNETVYPDATTAYNELRTTPAHRTALGAVAGVGFRFVDDYHLKVSPEVRYTLWRDSTFDSESTHSRRGQLEVGIAITF